MGKGTDNSGEGAPFTEVLEITVDAGQMPERIDKFLVGKLPQTSRTRIRNAADAGALKVNEKVVKVNYKVRPGDQIALSIPRYHEDYVIEPEEIPLDVVYEDNHLIVINKQAGLVVHPGSGNYTGTLVHGLLHHFGADADPELDSERPGLVHRLDKDTTGLMVIGKTVQATEHLSKQFHDRTTERRYKSLVWGDFAEKSGTIDAWIGRHPRHRIQQAAFPDGDQGKHAVTHYEVEQALGYVSLIRCKLETGRMHQIRVHLAHIGHPVFGDALYGGDRIRKGTLYTKYKQFATNLFKILPRQALHAEMLGFEHPDSGERMRFEAPLPEDFATVLERWRVYMGALTTRGDAPDGTESEEA